MPSKFDQETIDAAMKLYESGVTSVEVAKQFNTTRQTVERWYAKHGSGNRQKAVKQGKPSEPDYAKVERKAMKQHCLDLYAQGKSSYEIEEATGVNASLIYRWAKAAGINRSRTECSHKRRSPSVKAMRAMLSSTEEQLKIVSEALTECVSHMSCGTCPSEVLNACPSHDEGYHGVCCQAGNLTEYLLKQATDKHRATKKQAQFGMIYGRKPGAETL